MAVAEWQKAEWQKEDETMRFAQRLQKLERIPGWARQPRLEMPAKERTAEEEADAMGAFLWIQDNRQVVHYRTNSPFDSAMRAWHAAAALAREQGCAEYQVGLRPMAMTVWLLFRPRLVEHRRTHGEWLWDDPPSDAEVISLEGFRALDVSEKVRLLRDSNHRRGHWSKVGRH